MDAETIQLLFHQTAEEIRRYTASQVETWQAIPYWTLESEGRGGWVGGWDLPYKYGLLGIDVYRPHRLFVELSTGRLVYEWNGGLDDAPDQLIVTTYAISTHLFDADQRLTERKARATDGQEAHSKEYNDNRRAELRARYNVPRVWTAPATRVTPTYG